MTSDDTSALVIIDLQSDFLHELYPLDLERVLKTAGLLIQEARTIKVPIVFVEYGGCGSTHLDLVQQAEGHYQQVYKHGMDGAEAVHEFLKQISRRCKNS